MSHDVIKRGVNDLIKLNIIYKNNQLRPGQVNEYEIRLPSEIPEIIEMINADKNILIEEKNEDLEDFYTNPEKRIRIFERDNKKCFYCLCELQKNTFYLDHIFPRSRGGENYKFNLITACKICNSKKSDKDAENFLLDSYRGGLITQEEFLKQKATLESLIEKYKKYKVESV
ncbi:MAG: HNH endonuclease [Arcobacter sp.]|nr:HNH endonuclease [Arcobacter sp.]